MPDHSDKVRDELGTLFAESFLKIVACPHRGECKSDFVDLDTSSEPQGGFIGRNYWKNRILLIGQNPGGGKSPRANLGAEDNYYYSLVDAFRRTRIQKNFSFLMEYLETTFMPKWPMFRSFDLERNWGIGISDIVLINAVHCRTKNDAAPGRRIAERCFREHTSKQIDILEPRLIICFGKKAYDFLNKLYDDPIAPIKYILHPSGQYTRQNPDKQMKLVDEISQFFNGGRKPKHTISKKPQPKKRLLDAKENITKKGGNLVTSKDTSIVREQLKNYLISIGFKEVPSTFLWSSEHSVLGKINYLIDGRIFGFNLLSTDMRNNCGYSSSQRKKLSYEERETIYTEYLKKKPYYKDIKHGLKFYFRKAATDYVGLKFGIGFERIKNLIEYEMKS